MKNILDFKIYSPVDCVYHILDPLGTYATLVVGSRESLLVDTCTGCGSLKEAVETLTDAPVRVVNTHSHLDHAGGNYQFPKVFMDPSEIELGRQYMENMDIRTAVLQHFDKLGCSMGSAQKAQYLSYQMENVSPLPFGEIDLGDLHVLPVKMPSHTPGMTGFLVKEKQLLLGGDSVCQMACLYFPESSSIEAHLKLLREISKLRFSHILTSHSKELLDRDNLEAMIECAENYASDQTCNYSDRFYPQLRGRMFLYESKKHRHAIIVARNG